MLDGDVELRQLEKILAQEQHDAAWFDAQHRYEAIDGYAAKARAAQLLNGLGFANDTLERPVTSFSGGWRMRLNLARALMHRADLLLLDEPTNHLDLEAILWLEQYLARYPGSMLLVSHDREFLNACVNRIAHVHDSVIDSYTGDYDDFERARAEKIAQQNQAFQTATGKDRPPGRFRAPLPRQGHQGQAGAKPRQGAGAAHAHRPGACRPTAISSWKSKRRSAARTCCCAPKTWASAMATRPCSRTSIWCCAPARASPCSGRTARANPR